MRLSGFKSLARTDRDPEEPLVELRGVRVKYPLGSKRDDFQSLAYRLITRGPKTAQYYEALRGVDFLGYAGDIVGIIGPNGAGKSTLCKVISGVLRPDSGTTNVRGDVYALLSLGMGFNNELSGRENIFLNGMMLGLSKSYLETMLPQIEEFSGLGRFMDQPIKSYSNGMRARLGFSVAVMVRPEILILDETLSVGDAEFSQKAAAKMQELVQNASLVIVVTHSTDFVRRHCTKAMWLEKGEVRAFGAPADVVTAYQASLPKSPTPPPTRIANLPETATQRTDRVVVTVQNVSVQFPLKNRRETFQALKNVSFTVRQGDIVGIIGRNGAGKTTLCKVLTGILKPDSGACSVVGETAALLTLGAGFNDQLTGRDNILLNGMMLGIPKRDLLSMQEEIVRFADIGSWIDKPVKQYSRGMRSRLAFSIAATVQPDVFLVDEALAVGDLAFYEKASRKMQELMTRAKAVMVVTHDMAFVQRVCTRALWLDQGMLKHDGPAKETVERYLASMKR